VRVVNWSPDSKRIISGALDNVIRVFDVETGTLLCEPLTGHKNNLTALSSRPSLQGGEPEVVSGALHLFSFIHQSTDPPLSASLDGTVRVWALRMTGFIKTQTFSGYHRDWVRFFLALPNFSDELTNI
jgi:WD40 repeat protein